MPIVLAAAGSAAVICLAPVAVDGDTLRCSNLGLVRLIGIDAPEMAGHCRPGRTCTPGDGVASAHALGRLIAGRNVACSIENRDRYGRILARCTAVGRDLSCAMVQGGWAVPRYRRIDCG